MQCPIDGSQLVMTERSGVEIDYCPQCRGVWLDRGELDKIIERAAGPAQVAAAPPPPPLPGAGRSDYDRRPPSYDDRRESHHGGDYHQKKKRRGFLDDIFDF
ncbi:MAG: zf-TFIIB domain-containing protein [Rhodobacteraceae bacterium]|nr:zf-TFIIB domain-containing protein [Paracoccaceae bacterium]